MVGVEDRDQFARRMLQAVVEIAGFRMCVLLAGEIADVERFAESFEVCETLLRAMGFNDLFSIAFLYRPTIVKNQTVILPAG